MTEESQVQFPYYLPDEVVLHNQPNDCWCTCLGCVYDLTQYVTKNPDSPISKYIIAYGGKDVTHWFNVQINDCKKSVKLRRYVEPKTGKHQILLPYSFPKPERGKTKLIPVTTNGVCECSCCTAARDDDKNNSSNNDNDDEHVNYSPDTRLTGNCWSELEYIFNTFKYRIGWLTKNPRPCRITNVLTGQRAIISVCEEDSIKRIQERALLFNCHGASYTWKYEGKLLNPALTLSENGICDERDRYLACGLPDDATTYIPNLLCYYNDDLTEL